MHWRKIFYAPANLSKLPSFRADLGVANILISAQIRSTLAGKQAFQSDGLPPKGTNVPAIRIHLSAGGLLAFDLKEVLAALGPSGLITYWAVGDVACRGGNFDATGEGAVALEELAVSGERIIGSRLAHIAESVQQVIWGEFKGYEDILSNAPLVVVIAFDSSWWEVQSADATLVDRVAEAFKNVERVPRRPLWAKVRRITN